MKIQKEFGFSESEFAGDVTAEEAVKNWNDYF